MAGGRYVIRQSILPSARLARQCKSMPLHDESTTVQSKPMEFHEQSMSHPRPSMRIHAFPTTGEAGGSQVSFHSDNPFRPPSPLQNMVFHGFFIVFSSIKATSHDISRPINTLDYHTLMVARLALKKTALRASLFLLSLVNAMISWL